MEKCFSRCSARSVLGALLFLIYINDLPDGLTSIFKIFADDTELFSKTINKKKSEIEHNKDLKLISQWAYQWKMLFNLEPTKQATEVCFSHKRDNVLQNTICTCSETSGAYLRFQA